MPIALGAFAVTLAATSGCAPKGPPADLASLRPADPRLAELYESACMTCHVTATSGAPLTHDASAWAPRWKQGEAVLLDHVVQGYRGMPALGQCATCTPDDLKRLIRFLAGHEETKG